MSPFYFGLIIGVFVGVIAGYTLCALMVISKENDKKEE